MAELSEEDKEDLRDGKVIREGVRSEFWRVLKKRLEKAINLRQIIVMTPLHAVPEADISAGDFVSRAAQLEHIKGAVIGLQIARDLPARMIESVEQILASEKESPDDDAE